MANHGAHVTMCDEHGRTPWCFEDYNGQHLDYDQCACLHFRASLNCDLFVHRVRAEIEHAYVNGMVGA